MIIRNAASHAEFNPEKMGKAVLAAAGSLYAGLNAFEPGQHHAAHVHSGQDKLYFVLGGTGEVTIGEEHSLLAPGDLALAPAGVEHALGNPGPGRLVVLVILSPPPAKE